MEQLSLSFFEDTNLAAKPSSDTKIESNTHEESDSKRALVLMDALQTRLQTSLRLVITDNKRLMISAVRKKNRLEIRLHHMFLHADETIINALSRYIAKRDRRSGALLDNYIRDHQDHIDTRRRRRSYLDTHHQVHHLGRIMKSLETHFSESMKGLTIGWGRYSTRKRQHTIQLGSYSREEFIIRIHPVLDHSWVPEYYVASVVFHEMLHHVVPPRRIGRVFRHHTEDFLRRERAFEHFSRSREWEKRNLSRLLRAASKKRSSATKGKSATRAS